MDIIRLAESKLVYEESGQQLEEKQDILYSGQIVRIKFKKSQRFLFSTHFTNSNKQNNKNKNNQVEQMIFSNDQEEFQDNQFTIYKLDSDKKFEEKFKNIGKGMNEQLIYSGDEVVIMHNQTNSYLFQSNPNEAQKTKQLNELVATKFPKNENSTLLQQLYRFVFVLVDVNGNKCIELNNEIVISGKFYNQVIYSTEQIINQEQKHYEVGCRIYDNFNEGDIILLQDAENSFDFKKVKVDQNIKDNQVVVIKHSSSGCVLGIQNNQINQKHSVEQIAVKQVSEQISGNPEDQWRINLEYYFQDTLDYIKNEEGNFIGHNDIISLKNLENEQTLVSGEENFCPINKFLKLDIKDKNKIEFENDYFQIKIIGNELNKNQFLAKDLSFQLVHVNSGDYLICEKQLIDENQYNQQINNKNFNSYQYSFQPCCKKNVNQNINTYFQISDIRNT